MEQKSSQLGILLKSQYFNDQNTIDFEKGSCAEHFSAPLSAQLRDRK